MSNIDSTEVPEPLNVAPEMDAVIAGEEVRLARAEAIVLFRDSLARIAKQVGLPDGVELQFAAPLPVKGIGGAGTVEGRALVGSASVAWEGDRLVAHLTLVYDCPERLLLQTGEYRIYAEAEFYKTDDSVSLRSFFLTTDCPLDERETPLRLLS